MTVALRVHNTIKQTTSLCPVCRGQVDSEVYEQDEKVYLRKACPEHGEFNVLINSDARFYYPSQGATGGCCGGACGGGHDPGLIEQASTCIALIEIVESCNLRCPTCYADSPFSDPKSIRALSIEQF